MHIAPGSLACIGRAAYYRREARRIDALAAELGEEGGAPGQARFQEVAQEYRALADTLDPDDETAADDAARATEMEGDGLDQLGHPVAA